MLEPGDEAGELAAEAADAGATVLGIAGGDGSLAPVAAVAVERGLEFVCVPVGTRNHFACDAGLDPNDPFGAMHAFTGRERRVDVGTVNGRVFPNGLGNHGSGLLITSSNNRVGGNTAGLFHQDAC